MFSQFVFILKIEQLLTIDSLGLMNIQLEVPEKLPQG